MRILVPSAGNRSVIFEALREQPGVERLVTTEIDELAPAAYFADRCYRVPRSNDPRYLAVLEAICQEEEIDLLVPLADLDLVRFAKERARFSKLGVQVWVAPDRTLELALDKWTTYQLFRKLSIPTPETVLLSQGIRDSQKIRFPVFLKPRHAGMKNSPRYFFSTLHDEEDLSYYARKLKGQEEDYLIQESVAAGREVNVDFFVQDGQLKRLVTLYRLKAGDGGGIIRGQTIPCDPRIRETVEKLTEVLEFQGAANIQAFVMDDNSYFVTEINPRFANSSALVTRPAGVDFFALTIQMIQGVSIKKEFDKYRMIRVTSSYQPLLVEKIESYSTEADRPVYEILSARASLIGRQQQGRGPSRSRGKMVRTEKADR